MNKDFFGHEEEALQWNLYSWGGSRINQGAIAKSNTNTSQSMLKKMNEFSNRKISLIDLSYSNTVIITGQQRI